MSKYLEQIRQYFRKGLYSKAHLEMLEIRGVITAEERRAIEQGE
jgi:hypothetical protein